MIFERIRGLMLALAASSAFLSAVPPVSAQQDAAPSPGQGGDQTATPAEPGGQNAPGPVGGVEAFRFPGGMLGHSFIVPRLGFQELYDTNAGYAATPGASRADAISSVSGGLTLQWVKRSSTLSLDYSAQGLLYNSQSQSNGVVQQLGVTEKLSLRRWNLVFGENFSYLPNSEFGLGGLGFLGGGTSGLPGVGGVTGFNPFQGPTQTIAAANVSQLSSTSVFQAQYLINATNSVSGSISAGFLHFFGDNLLNSRTISGRFGYDHSFTARDTLNFSYTGTVIDYPSGVPGFTSHYIQVGYRRILTGRLHLSVSAGPSITQFSQTTVPGSTNQVGWSLSSSLNYALRNGALSAQYSRGVSAGSGFLVGSVADQVSGTLTKHITRVWSANLTGSFARNSAFQQTTTGKANPQGSFDFWTAGGSLSRPIGHFSALAFSYNASRQTTNSTICVNKLACGPVALVQVIGATFNWSTRPHRLE